MTRQRRSQIYWNLRLFGLPEPIKDLWLLVLSIIIVVSLTGQTSTIDRQREGRGIAIRVLCGAQQGVIDAGRAQLLASANVSPPRFARALEALGYPPLRVRRRHAQAAAATYSRTVGLAVAREAGIDDLFDHRAGQLRCDRLVGVARAK